MMAEQTLSNTTGLAVPSSGRVRVKPNRETDALGEVGWYLQRERVRRGETINDCARICEIDPVHIAAIEHGDLTYLPKGARIFTVLAGYASHLGFEPEPLVAHYSSVLRRQTVGQNVRPALDASVVWLGDFIGSARHFGKYARQPAVLGVVIATFIGAVSYYLVGLAPNNPGDNTITLSAARDVGRVVVTTGSIPGRDDIASEINRSERASRQALPEKAKLKPVPEFSIKERRLSDIGKGDPGLPAIERDKLAALIERDIQQAYKAAPKKLSDTDRPKQIVAHNTPSSSPAPVKPGAVYGEQTKDVRLVLHARKQVWIRVEDRDGNILFTQTLGVGDSYRVPNKKGLVLDARNAGVIDYTIDGAKSRRLGNPGEIVIGVSLDPARLETRLR